MSNNVAEFAGAYLIIEWLALNEITEKINIIGDSMIVVNRMKKGHGRKMNGLYAPMALQCLDTLKLVKTKITWSWQPRAHNHTCDLLCSEEMKSARERKANRADLKNVAALGERIARDDRRDHAN
jgi:ribonuclease HI